MRLDKDPGDNWSKKFGVNCLDGNVPTWEDPDWPTCASSKFWLELLFCQISLYSPFCQISHVRTHTLVVYTATSQSTGPRAKFQDTRKVSSNATLSLSCFFWLLKYSLKNLIKQDSFISLKCTDERYLLKRRDKEPVRELSATCFWSQSWSLDLSDLKCELSFCRPDPIIPPDSKVQSVFISCTRVKRPWSTPKTGQGLARGSCTNVLLVPVFSIRPTQRRRPGMNSILFAFKREYLKSSQSGQNAGKRYISYPNDILMAIHLQIKDNQMHQR